jgi:hypothetical protein
MFYVMLLNLGGEERERIIGISIGKPAQAPPIVSNQNTRVRLDHPEGYTFRCAKGINAGGGFTSTLHEGKSIARPSIRYRRLWEQPAFVQE